MAPLMLRDIPAPFQALAEVVMDASGLHLEPINPSSMLTQADLDRVGTFFSYDSVYGCDDLEHMRRYYTHLGSDLTMTHVRDFSRYIRSTHMSFPQIQCSQGSDVIHSNTGPAPVIVSESTVDEAELFAQLCRVAKNDLNDLGAWAITNLDDGHVLAEAIALLSQIIDHPLARDWIASTNVMDIALYLRSHQDDAQALIDTSFDPAAAILSPIHLQIDESANALAELSQNGLPPFDDLVDVNNTNPEVYVTAQMLFFMTVMWTPSDVAETNLVIRFKK